MERFDGWDTELYHHGIKGQKWGIRRFQNPDGTLTEEGRAKYGKRGFYREVKNISKNSVGQRKSVYASEILRNHPKIKEASKKLDVYSDDVKKSTENYHAYKAARFKHDAKRYFDKTGEFPESEKDLQSVDRGLRRKSEIMEWSQSRYTKESKKEARKLLGLYGNLKLYSSTGAGNMPNIEKSRDIVAGVLRRVSDEREREAS